MSSIVQKAVEVVAIFDSTSLTQVFVNAAPMKAEVRETSRVMRHPVETGVVLSDHHIINPREISLSIIISATDYNSTYQQLKSAFDAALLLSVQTKTGIYPNMIIEQMPHEETPEMYDVIRMDLRLMEVLYILPSSSPGAQSQSDYDPEEPQDEDTVRRGQQSTSTIDTTGTPLTQHGATGSW